MHDMCGRLTSIRKWYHSRRLPVRLCTGAVLLAALVVSMVSLVLAAPPSFPDVPVGHQYYAAVNDLASRGIIGGYTNGDFGVDDAVKRQQFAKMAVLTGGYPVSEGDVCPYTDVAQGGSADPLFPDNYIAVCAARGITTGKTPTTFDPYSNISRLQATTMVVRMADNLQPGLLAAPPAGWSGNAAWAGDATHGANAARAEYNGLLAGLSLSTLSPTGNMTRGEVAQVLHNLLGRLAPGGSTTTAGGTTSTTTPPTTTTDPLTTTTTLGHSGYENLGGIAAPGSGPGVASWGPGRLDVFIRGVDGSLMHRAYDDAWGEWESLGGMLTSDPTAVSWGPNRIDVFARGENNHLIHVAWTGAAWTSWETLDYTLYSAPAVCSPDLNMLGLAWRTTGSAIEFLGFRNGTWFPWISLPNSGSTAPACVAASMTDADLFITDATGKLHRSHYNGSSWTSEDLGGDYASGPGACSWGANRLDVFVRGPLDNLMQKSYNGSWSAWTALQGTVEFQGDPDAVCWGPNRIDLFAVGKDLTVWHKYWDETQWKP